MLQLNKILYIIFVLLLLTQNYFADNYILPNKWEICLNDNEATEVAGFSFPVKLSRYSIQARKGLIEIKYSLGDIREIYIRKSDRDGRNGDISEIYTYYPIDKEIQLKNGNIINVKMKDDKIYIIYFKKLDYYYSAYCPDGIKEEEIEKVTNIF